MSRIGCLLLFLAVPAAVLAQSDSTWRQHSAAAQGAIAQGDWNGAQRQLLEVDRLLGGHPSIAFALARAALRLGDTAQALAQVERVAAMAAANATTIGAAQVVATIPDSSAIAEDLAWDAARRRFLVSDVHGHRLWSVGLDGRTAGFGEPMAPGWAVLAVGVDAAHAIAWVTTVTLPQAEGYTPRDSGHAAIVLLDLASGSVRRRFDLPSPSSAAPGDLAIAENGDVFFGDGQTGEVRVIRSGRDSVETLVSAGRLHGTQQPAIAPDGRTLFIADYGRGIARVDRTSGSVIWLDHGPGVTLTGIDGLVTRGMDLIAVQNGVNPNRIVRLTLDAALGAVTSAEILLRDTALAPEPTHVVQVGEALYAIGNAGWNKYGEDGVAKTDVPFTRPRLVRLTVR